MAEIDSRVSMYQRLWDMKDQLVQKLARLATDLGLQRGQGSPRQPSEKSQYSSNALHQATTTTGTAALELSRHSYDPAVALEQLQSIVKGLCGDEYDVITVPRPIDGVELAFSSVVYPAEYQPARLKYLSLWEKNISLYPLPGLPFPPRYLHMMEWRQPEYLWRIISSIVGGQYQCHGIRFSPTPLLTSTNPGETAKRLMVLAEDHSDSIAAVFSLCHDTPGSGYGDKDEEGVPRMLKEMSRLSREFQVPYIIFNPLGIPLLGPNPAAISADLVIYGGVNPVWNLGQTQNGSDGMLIVGTEEIVGIIKHVAANTFGVSREDQGRVAVCYLETVNSIKGQPTELPRKIETVFKTIVEEFDKTDSLIKKHLLITPSLNVGGVEIDYSSGWKEGPGLPIFSEADSREGFDMISMCLQRSAIDGVMPYSGGVVVFPGIKPGTIIWLRHLLELLGQASGILG